MKQSARRILALVLCLCLLLGIVPTVQAEEPVIGNFSFAVMTANNTVVEPTVVSYTAGQTILEALLAAGYEMEITEDGTVTSINGVEASYLRYYDNGGYDMNVPASGIRAMLFCGNDVYSEAMLDLICVMSAYNTATNHVQNDPAAREAYGETLVAMRSADEQTAAALCETLRRAVADYEALLNGQKYTVSFQVSQADEAVESAAVTMTDAYGNVTEGFGSVAVVAGEYTYCVRDGGVNRTEGVVTVRGDCSVAVTLPSGDWFGDITALSGDHLDADGNKLPFEAVRSGHTVTWYIDDAAGSDSVYLHAQQGDVPDVGTKLYALYEGTNGFDYSASYRSWSSTNVKLTNLLDAGMEGREFVLEARYSDGNTTQYQTMQVQIIRVPSLKNLSLTQNSGPLWIPFDPMVTEYDLRATDDDLTIHAEAFTAEGTDITVNGSSNPVITLQDGANTADILVSHSNGQSMAYTLHITRSAAAAVTLQVPQGVQAEIRNLGGDVITPQADGLYSLIPGDTYECVSTTDTWYHAVNQFVAADGMTVTAAMPEKTDYLSDIAFYDRSPAATRKMYELDQAFSSSVHSYTMPVFDTAGALYVQATETAQDISTVVYYASQSASADKCGRPASVLVGYDVSDTGFVTYMSAALAASGYTQNFTVRAQREINGVLHYQEYKISAPKILHLNSFSSNVDGEKLDLLDANGSIVAFNRTQLSYTVQVLSTAKQLQMAAMFPNEDEASLIGGGYYAVINGQRYDSLAEVSVDLANIADGTYLTVQICHEDDASVSQTYSIRIEKAEPIAVRFQVNPEDATVFVINNKNGAPVYALEDGSYPLIPGGSYTYNVTAKGYRSYSNSRYNAPEQDKTVKVTLNQAPENTTLPDYEAEWPSFRQNVNNNGVMNAASPVKSEDAVLYWAKKIGLGWYGDACGCPILVDDHIYIYAGEKIFKLDKITGEIVAEGDMDHSSNFAITNATYGDGMIFVGLSNGSVQAFHAETLESLWLYEDALGGQPNCPIAYRDGYVYTGFWRSETADANFVCLSATDEDPTQTKEAKVASWTYTTPGGFYWSGAHVSENYVLVGTDDGQTGNSKGHASLVCLDVHSGAVLSVLQLPHTGDIRCSITYDETTGAYYFTTKGGYFYEVRVDAAGQIDGSSLRAIALQNGSGKPAGSSSSPTVYNGRAYVGVGGTGAYAPYSGHNISVIDLENWEIAYCVPTQGNPQTSGVLTTAYDVGDGSVYIYFLDNYTPGKLRVIQDRAGQSEPMELITEVYKEQNYQVAPVLFTPYDKQTQYAICSPIVDSDGTLYFKNDSGYLMAVGTQVESLELTAAPQKTEYFAGECFDPAGMQITAVYANGTRRDVTAGVIWNTDSLTTQDDTFEVVLPMLYQNGADGQSGVPADSPVITLELKIKESAQPMEMPFQDVPDNAFYYEPVLWAVSNDITSGTSANTFSPDANCTRGQVVTFLWRAAGCPEPESTDSPFQDVSRRAFYYKATLWAAENGITAGTSANTFSPDATCTRAQVVTFLWRAAGKPAPRSQACGFGDVQQNSFYYRAMLWAVGEKITTGISKTSFAPENNCSRGQIVTFLYRYDGIS